MKIVIWLGLVSLVLSLLVGLHQFYLIGIFFQFRDALHHEFFIALFLGLGIGFLSEPIVRILSD